MTIFEQKLQNTTTMKNSIIILVLLVCSGVFAQGSIAKKVNELVLQNTTFKKYVVLNENGTISTNETRTAVAKATYGQLNIQAVNAIFTKQDDFIELEIPYQGSTITTQLFKVDIFAEGFHIDTDQVKAITYQKGAYYRGIIKGNQNSIVSFSFFKDEFSGVISSRTLSNLVVAKLDKPNNISDYIIYSDQDLLAKNTFECKVKESFEEVPEQLRNQATPATTRCVTMYFEIDYDLYQANGSDTTTTTNWMTSVFNNVQTIYTNDGITTSLKSMFIWTTPDPYDGIGDSSSDYLYKFNELRPVFDGDLGQLLGIDPGGLGGVAVGINGICTQ
ncbi:MAG: M12 family metallo-peptidase, partial [Bacteroidota bacterium]